MDEHVSLRIAADRFDVNIERLRKAASDGRLGVIRFGNERLVRPSEVLRFLRDGGRRVESRQPTSQARAEAGSMTHVIAITAPKGGVGKTTTALNLSAALAERGRSVLLVDLDPQGSLTRAAGFEPEALDQTVYSAIKAYIASYEVVELPVLGSTIGVDLVPSNSVLTAADEELLTAVRREAVLEQLLRPIKDRYDHVIIDTPPSLGVLVQNALVAACAVIIPLEAEFLATPSIPLILQKVGVTRRSGLNTELAVAGILLTMVDGRTVMSRETVEFVHQRYGGQVPIFRTMIRRSVQFPNSQASGQSILQYDPGGDGSRAYRALAMELLDAQA